METLENIFQVVKIHSIIFVWLLAGGYFITSLFNIGNKENVLKARKEGKNNNVLIIFYLIISLSIFAFSLTPYFLILIIIIMVTHERTNFIKNFFKIVLQPKLCSVTVITICTIFIALVFYAITASKLTGNISCLVNYKSRWFTECLFCTLAPASSVTFCLATIHQRTCFLLSKPELKYSRIIEIISSALAFLTMFLCLAISFGNNPI